MTHAPVHAWHAPADPAVAPDLPLRDGDRVGAWQAIHTPGHASDHLCFLGPGGVLLSGDHVMSWSTSVIGAPGGNMADYFRSLERLLAFDAAPYLPGHGPKLEQPRAFVAALLEHRRQRESAILAALRPEPTTIRDIAAALLSPSTHRSAAPSNETSPRTLQKLKQEGEARETVEGWRTT